MTHSNQQSNSTVEEMQKYFDISASGVTLPYVTITLEKAAEFIEKRYLPRKQVEADKALLLSDLAWCLGKLRGLGYPAEHLESKYNLKDQQ
jgi:hypothetical protein